MFLWLGLGQRNNSNRCYITIRPKSFVKWGLVGLVLATTWPAWGKQISYWVIGSFVKQEALLLIAYYSTTQMSKFS